MINSMTTHLFRLHCQFLTESTAHQIDLRERFWPTSFTYLQASSDVSRFTLFYFLAYQICWLFQKCSEVNKACLTSSSASKSLLLFRVARFFGLASPAPVSSFSSCAWSSSACSSVTSVCGSSGWDSSVFFA